MRKTRKEKTRKICRKYLNALDKECFQFIEGIDTSSVNKMKVFDIFREVIDNISEDTFRFFAKKVVSDSTYMSSFVTYKFFSKSHGNTMYVNLHICYFNGSYDINLSPDKTVDCDSIKEFNASAIRSTIYNKVYECFTNNIKKSYMGVPKCYYHFYCIINEFILKNPNFLSIIKVISEEMVKDATFSHTGFRRFIRDYEEQRFIKRNEFIEAFCSNFSNNIPNDIKVDEISFLMKSSHNFISSFLAFSKWNPKFRVQMKFIPKKWIKEAVDAINVSKVMDK